MRSLECSLQRIQKYGDRNINTIYRGSAIDYCNSPNHNRIIKRVTLPYGGHLLTRIFLHVGAYMHVSKMAHNTAGEGGVSDEPIDLSWSSG